MDDKRTTQIFQKDKNNFHREVVTESLKDKNVVIPDKAHDAAVNVVYKNPHRRYLKIDDAKMTYDSEIVNCNKEYKKGNTAMGGKLFDTAMTLSGFVEGDIRVPIMSEKEYMKEMKDTILLSADKVKERITRFWVSTTGDMEVGNVIILGRSTGPVLINDLYINERFVETKEYSLLEMQKIMETEMSGRDVSL